MSARTLKYSKVLYIAGKVRLVNVFRLIWNVLEVHLILMC